MFPNSWTLVFKYFAISLAISPGQFFFLSSFALSSVFFHWNIFRTSCCQVTPNLVDVNHVMLSSERRMPRIVQNGALTKEMTVASSGNFSNSCSFLRRVDESLFLYLLLLPFYTLHFNFISTSSCCLSFFFPAPQSTNSLFSPTVFRLKPPSTPNIFFTYKYVWKCCVHKEHSMYTVSIMSTDISKRFPMKNYSMIWYLFYELYKVRSTVNTIPNIYTQYAVSIISLKISNKLKNHFMI